MTILQIFIISLIVFILVALGMGIGVLFGRRGIRGSCGGSKTIEELGGTCPVCGSPREGKCQPEVKYKHLDDV